MQLRTLPILTAACAALALPLWAQTGEVKLLLVEGNPLPGITGAVINNLDVPSTNSIGGWAVGLDFIDSATTQTIDLAWGTADGVAAAGELFREGTYGDLLQTSWETSSGIADDGTIGYSPGSENLVTGATGLDGVWVNDQVIALEDEPIPALPGKVFRFASRPSILPDGRAVYVAGINDGLTGSGEGNGLFRDDELLLKTGDTLPGVPGPLDGNAADFDFRFSPDGTNYILTTDDSSASFSDDAYVVVNGAGISIAGTPVHEGAVFPVSLGGDGIELWDNFDFYGIRNDGVFAFTGDLDGATSTDEFIYYDGEIVAREGDVLPNGQTLTGTIDSFGLSDNGAWAAAWDMDDGVVTREILLINGVLALAEGDAVDLDGDGTVDPGVRVNDFAGLNALALAPDGTVYVVAELDLTGTGTNDLEVLLEVKLPALSVDRDTVSVSANETAELLVAVPGDVEADFYFMAGSVTGTAPGIPIDGFLVPLNFDSYTNYTLNVVNGPALNPNFGSTDARGIATVASTPGVIAPASAIGATVSHAYLTLSIAGPAPITTFASNAASFVLAP